MVDGALEVGKKYRGKIETVYGQYIRDQLSDPDKLDLSRAFLSHSGGGISEETLQAMKKEILRCAPFQEVQIIRAGCTISAHCGPKTATVMFMENKRIYIQHISMQYFTNNINERSATPRCCTPPSFYKTLIFFIMAGILEIDHISR